MVAKIIDLFSARARRLGLQEYLSNEFWGNDLSPAERVELAYIKESAARFAVHQRQFRQQGDIN